MPISENDLFKICGLKTPKEFKIETQSSALFDGVESMREVLLRNRRTGKTTEIIIKALYFLLLEKSVLIWVSSFHHQNYCANLIRKYSKMIHFLSLEEVKFCRFEATNINGSPKIYIIFLHNNIPQVGDFYGLSWDIELDDSNPFE